MRRQISVWGCLMHLQWGSGVVWRPQAKIHQKRVIKVWIFRTLRRSCILCKWGARRAAGFRQEPRRSATELYRCFQRTGRPQNSKSAVVWFTWPFASSRTAFFTPVQSKRWAANRGFPVDLFVWCRCISRNGVCQFNWLHTCERLVKWAQKRSHALEIFFTWRSFFKWEYNKLKLPYVIGPC